MKKVRKIISVILVAVMLAGIAAIAPVTADAAVPAWKTAYENYVYKVRQEVDADGGWGWLKDLDGNGIPELFLSLRSFGSTQVISYYNGELKVVAASAYGKVYVQNNMFLLSWGRQGSNGDTVYRQNGKSNVIFDGKWSDKTNNYKYRYNETSDYTQASQSQYYSALNSVFDKSKAGVLNYNNCYQYTPLIIKAIYSYDSPPVAPNVSLSNNSAGICAEWNKVANAAKYNVFYKKASDSSWSSFQTTNNKAQLKNLKTGTLYYVQVQGVTYLGKKGYYSKVKSMTFLAQTKITSIDYNGINTIKYNSVGGANKYQIARLKSGDKAYTYFTTTSTSFSEYATGGIAYTYQVRPMYVTQNSGTAYGAWSPSKSIGTLIVPTLTLSNKGKAVVANWNSVPEAVKYEVYFKSASASKWSMVTTTKTTLPITGVVSGTTYYVQVRPIGNKVSGRYSAVKSIRYYTTVMPELH